MESLSGLSASEVLGKKPLEIFPFLRESKVIGAFEKALEGVTTVSEEIAFCVPKTGKSGWSKITSRPLRNADGEIVGVLEIVRDITEHKINNDVLLQSQSLLNEMSRIAKIGAWKIDVETQKVERTEEIFKIFEIDSAAGPPSEEIIDSYYTPASLRLRQETVRHTMETGEPFDIEVEIFTAKGNRRWMRIIGNAVISDGKITHRVGVTQDITERKKIESTLVQSQKMLSEMGRIAKIGAWKTDTGSGLLQCTEELFSIYEVDSSFPMNLDKLLEFYTPASRELLQQSIRRTMQTGESFDIELEMTSAKGNRKWLRAIGNAAYTDGKISHRVGITQDITEQKRIADAQFESELRYRALFNSIRDAISVSNRDREIIDCNRAFIDLFGYSLSEVKGKNASILYDSREEYENTGKLMQSHIGEAPLLVQINYRKKSGEVFISENLIQNLNNTDGKPIGFIGLIRDITFRKEAEKKILTLLKEKEILLKEVHHRIKNNMNTMMSLLSLQANEAKNPETASTLKDAQNRFQSMGLLYEKLYRTEYPHEMPVKVYLSPLVDEIIHLFPNSTRVKIEKNIDDFNLGVKELSSLGIIVNELLTNTMKYAFTGRDGGTVTVAALKIGSRVSITIGDNGRGLPAANDLENSEGFGLKLVATMIKQLNGTLQILRERGTEFVVEFDTV
jgi:PAS domain S-box-containing protein